MGLQSNPNAVEVAAGVFYSIARRFTGRFKTGRLSGSWHSREESERDDVRRIVITASEESEYPNTPAEVLKSAVLLGAADWLSSDAVDAEFPYAHLVSKIISRVSKLYDEPPFDWGDVHSSLNIVLSDDREGVHWSDERLVKEKDGRYPKAETYECMLQGARDYIHSRNYIKMKNEIEEELRTAPVRRPTDINKKESEVMGATVELNYETLAKIVNAINNRVCELNGDQQIAWEDAPGYMRNGLIGALQNDDVTPKESHDTWMKERLEAGWTLGPVKDIGKKISPCLVPYEDLPYNQKVKDCLVMGVKDYIKSLTKPTE